MSLGLANVMFRNLIIFHYFQKVLVHSRSRTVVATLKEAHAMNKRFEVYVTQSSFCATSSRGPGDANDSDDPMNRYYESIINL